MTVADHLSLRGKRILVTGGTTGIGRATIALLAQEGARVLTFGRHERDLAESLAHARDGSEAEPVGLIADAATREGIERVFAAVDEKLGGIDVLIACAALSAEPIHTMDEDAWRYAVETNFVGYLACARQAIQRMERAGGGHLVFVGSISTEIKAVGESVYAATKAGIQAFAETLRKEVADLNIRVTVIQPGSVDSDMQEATLGEKRAAVGSQRMLDASEIAEVIVFALTRSSGADLVNLRIEPRFQKTG